MTPSADPALAPMLAGSASRLLRAGVATAGAAALACAALAAVLLAWPAPPSAPALALVLVLLPVERVFAFRLRFDAGLFAELAQAGAHDDALAALDAALHRLRLRAAPATLRPLLDRVRGARRLMLWHGLTVAAQLVSLGWALIAGRGG